MSATAVLTPRAANLDQLPAGCRLGTRDLMSLLGCSKSTLLRRLARGEAPPPVQGTRLEWRAGDVRDFLGGGAA